MTPPTNPGTTQSFRVFDDVISTTQRQNTHRNLLEYAQASHSE